MYYRMLFGELPFNIKQPNKKQCPREATPEDKERINSQNATAVRNAWRVYHETHRYAPDRLARVQPPGSEREEGADSRKGWGHKTSANGRAFILQCKCRGTRPRAPARPRARAPARAPPVLDWHPFQPLCTRGRRSSHLC